MTRRKASKVYILMDDYGFITSIVDVYSSFEKAEAEKENYEYDNKHHNYYIVEKEII